MMLHALKWSQLHTRMLFGPDDGGGGGGGSEAPASAPSSAEPGGGSAGGDGGATPSRAEGPAPSTESAAPAPPQEFDWSALGSSDDLDSIAIPPEAATPPAKPEPPKEPTPQPVPPPQPQPAPTTPPSQAADGATSEAPLSASEPWRIAEALEANRDMALAHLAQTKFALSEQDIKDLDTDVTVAVPRLLARVFLESQVSMQKFLAQAVPGMVQKYNKVSSANEGAEKQFFTRHPALDMNNPQHRATTVRIASMYRQANPGIPLNQLIDEVGPMVMASLRINAQAPTTKQPAARSAAQAFVPAVNGGGGLSSTPEPSNPWEGLGRTYDDA